MSAVGAYAAGADGESSAKDKLLQLSLGEDKSRFEAQKGAYDTIVSQQQERAKQAGLVSLKQMELDILARNAQQLAMTKHIWDQQISPDKQQYYAMRGEEFAAQNADRHVSQEMLMQQLQHRIREAATQEFNLAKKGESEPTNTDTSFRDAVAKYGEPAVYKAFMQASQTGRHWSEFLNQIPLNTK